MDELNSEIRRLTLRVWDEVLSTKVEVAETVPTSAGPVVYSCVHISDAWNGVVALSCGERVSGKAAARMFQLKANPTTVDLQDALGELTNMIGGILKAILPQPSRPSLPTSIAGRDFSVRFLHSRVLTAVPFRCDGDFITVAVLQRDAASL